MWAKLGLTPPEPAPKLKTSAFASEEAAPAPPPPGLVNRALQLLHDNEVDYTIFWRRLSERVAGRPVDRVRDLFLDRPAIDVWLRDYQTACAAQDPQARATQGARMLQTNPKFVLRNHLGELAIRAAQQQDFAPLAQLQAVLERPFDEHPGHEDWADFPPDWAASIHLSCSS